MDALESGIKRLENYRAALLKRADLSGEIDQEAKHFLLGVHFCPDWDGMAIYKDSPEWECCTCQIRKEIDFPSPEDG